MPIEYGGRALHLIEINNAKNWILSETEWDIPFDETFEKVLKEYEPCITKIEKINITIVESYNGIEINLKTYKVAYILHGIGFPSGLYCELFVDKKNFDRLLKLERICKQDI